MKLNKKSQSIGFLAENFGKILWVLFILGVLLAILLWANPAFSETLKNIRFLFGG